MSRYTPAHIEFLIAIKPKFLDYKRNMNLHLDAGEVDRIRSIHLQVRDIPLPVDCTRCLPNALRRMLLESGVGDD